MRRVGELLERTATRPLPELEQVRDWLASTQPAASETVVVHGDYRLGNVRFSPGGDAAEGEVHLAALLDWELAALGDPLADLGYLTATWAEPDDEPNPMLGLSTVTRRPGFMRRDELARRYEQQTGRDAGALGWYQVLALWQSAIFLEGSYRRHLAGSTDDPYFARLGEGVPRLAREALRRLRRA